MIRANPTQNSDDLKPDLTPLLDIIFIVMVFLLLTASVKLQSLEVELPTADTSSSAEVDKDSLSINLLAAEPHWALQGKEYESWEAFTAELLKQVAENPKLPVVIGSDKAVEVQYMIKLFAFLQDNDIKATQVLMKEEKK